MRYDFTKIIDRHGKDAIAVDGLGKNPGFAPEPPKDGFDVIPMWVADMNFETVPTIPKAIMDRAAHPAYGYFSPVEEYYDSIIRWHKIRNNVEGLMPEYIGYENGVLGGVISALTAFAAPGDAVLLHSPTYIGFTKCITENGYKIVPFHDLADVYVINTCSVTNMADRKSRQMIHRARKQNPDAVIVAAGCYVQAQADMGELDENIDIVIGNNKKKDLIRLLEEYFKEDISEQMQEVIDINHTFEYESLHLSRTAEHTRAYLKVQDGCNQFCTYCIIPYARGRVRSRKKEDVVEEVRTLAEHGYQEVVLTGIHLSSYGLEWKDENGKQTEGLLDLIRAVHGVEGIKRIRLGSLEPRIVTEEFAKELACLPKICPHFHLSLQSGCDATLKRMNRRYDAAEYREKCELLRKYFENPALTTDVIVGFPQESEEEFEASRDFVDSINFYETHIFKYSKRQGTKAAKMDGQIPEHEKTRRSNIMLELNRKKMQRYEEGWLGKKVEVLFEEMTERDGKNYVTGHTKEYLRIGVPCEPEQADRWINQLKEIELTSLSQIMH